MGEREWGSKIERERERAKDSRRESGIVGRERSSVEEWNRESVKGMRVRG